VTHLRKVARLLPIFAVDFFGFECRLGLGAAPADCAINLTPEGARMLAGQAETKAPDIFHRGPWPRVQQFYSHWAETATTPFADAGSTWIEFDVSSGEPLPNLLFGYWPLRHKARPPEWLTSVIIPLLLGFPLSAQFEATLLRCFEKRPTGTEDFQVGVMLSRNLPAVRICIFDLPTDAVFPYLESIGWHGPKERLAAYLEAFRPYSDFVGLHLDVGEQVYPHIGIEPNFVAGCWSRQPPKESRWEGQFEQLRKFELLTPEKQQALLGWIGYQSFGGGSAETLLLRGLSHIKVVLRPDGQAISKAYFGVAYRTLGVS
jgi:hypothetical protein